MSADTIDISLLVTRHNVRTDVDGDLVDAVKEHGVLEPLSIYLDDDKYVVHNGSRRLKAALIVGLTKVPYVLIDKPADDGTDIVRQVIVNTTQKALSYMDKAYAMRHLRDVCGWTQAAIADAFKLSAPDVSLAIRTTELPERLQDAVNSGIWLMWPSKSARCHV
jgi:ParB family chromosome partitioning protein